MSLKIEKKNAETLALAGRLDTLTAPELETEISAILPSVQTLILDMEKLDYISSAGLRVILKTQNSMRRTPQKRQCFLMNRCQRAFPMKNWII